MGKPVSQMTPEEHEAVKAKDRARRKGQTKTPEQRRRANEACARYRAKDPDKVRARNREQKKREYAANKEKILARNERYRQANKDKINVRCRERERNKLATDIDFRLLKNIRCRFFELAASKGTKNTRDFLDYTLGELRYHIATRFERGMSWDNWGEWHIDHIIPCTTFDHSDPEQVRECWALSNLQPLWAKDNLSKGAKVI